MINTVSTSVSDHVSHQRLNDRITEMACLGATAQGGVNRQALSAEDAQAQILLTRWSTALGMMVSRDPIGNLFLRLEGADPSLSPVMTGSHMDTQPTGGRYDGIYGVMASLEAVQALQDAGFKPKRAIEVVAWVNEEGSRFAPSLMGSGVHAGARSLTEALALRDTAGVSVQEALQQIEPLLAHIPKRSLSSPAHCYVEAHIEQGPILEREGLSIGVVTGIQGKHTYRVTVIGDAAHAGTAPHRERKDALLAATAMVQSLSRTFFDEQDITRFTVGRFSVAPNAPSVVPNEVVFSIDLRHPNAEKLEQLSNQVSILCQDLAAPCSVHIERLYTSAPIEFSEPMQKIIAAAALQLNLPQRPILSAAGHDAGLMHRVCPTGMLFIPSIGGVTHNEAEFSRPEDLTSGARVLANVLAHLAGH
ncbi:M20 family metallo-hydrolase [Pollutimonas bauzanensis]|uniref:M20 family metallo-hydrolase n=1 Tax=Pollutimonas bauzanensis TaxID=658167 RepID=UPI0033413075